MQNLYLTQSRKGAKKVKTLFVHVFFAPWRLE
jgi:hypothetical protein